MQLVPICFTKLHLGTLWHSVFVASLTCCRRSSQLSATESNRKQQKATAQMPAAVQKLPPQNLTPGQPFPTKVRTEERSSSGYQLLQVFLCSSCGLRSSLYLKQSEDACLIHAIQTAKGQTQWVRTSETRNTINCRGQTRKQKALQDWVQ